MVETGMFVYPWDMGGMDEFRREYPSTGCGAVALALSYHHASILSARKAKVYELPKAALSFEPNLALYGRLKPDVFREAAGSAVRETREWCRSTGRHFSAWAVILHNSTLGSLYPEICVENAMGDRYPHALCPSHPDVRQYAAALMEDICSAFSPDSVTVESAAYRTALHGAHHEISNVRVSPAILWLLSLCFCPCCMKSAGEEFNADPRKARETCAFLLKRLLNEETCLSGSDLGQVVTLLLEYPELSAYQTARQKHVAGFIEMLSGAAHKRSAEFRLIPSSTPFDVTSSFLEGMSFKAAEGRADALIPLIYGKEETYAKVRGNIRLMDENTPVGMAFTLHPQVFPDKGSFLGTVAEAARHKPRCAYFYNYSIASAERLKWVAEAAEFLKKS